jgi:hypothetical protein
MTKRNLNNVPTLSDEELLSIEGGWSFPNANDPLTLISDAMTYKSEVEDKRRKTAGGSGTDVKLTAFP